MFEVSPIRKDSFNSSLVGKLIRKHREKLGWNQAKLAKELSVDPTHISKIENGKGVSLAVLVTLSEILEFSLDDLVPGRLSARESRIFSACGHLTDAEFSIFIDVGKCAVDAYRRHR